MGAQISLRHLQRDVHLSIGDIEISLEEKVPILTSTSPLEFHEVDIGEREEEEVHLQEPHFIAGSLKMSEC